MSSLVTYSSPWNNDDNNPNKKRTPTMRKTIKNKPTAGDADEYTTYSENFQNSQPSTIDEAQVDSEARSVRVTELLNKITSSDSAAENKRLGNFQPLEPPSLNVKKIVPNLLVCYRHSIINLPQMSLLVHLNMQQMVVQEINMEII